MKKLISGIVVILLLTGYGIFHSSTSFAGKMFPLDGHEFTITQLDENGGNQELFISLDSEGHFYKEVKSGSGAGDFEIWDGEKFYRYTKNMNYLMIHTPPKEGKVIAHPFLSEAVQEEINEDLSEKKLKKQLFSSTYQKKYVTEDNTDVVEEIKFDSEINHPQKYTKFLDGKQVTVYEIDQIKEQNNPIRPNDYVDIEKLKANGVLVDEIN